MLPAILMLEYDSLRMGSDHLICHGRYSTLWMTEVALRLHCATARNLELAKPCRAVHLERLDKYPDVVTREGQGGMQWRQAIFMFS